MELLETILYNAVNLGILLFDFLGFLVIVAAGLQALYNLIRHKSMVRLNLAKGMALGLEFKLGGEILRTVIVRDFSEIATVACIIALRAALAVLIHWEIKHGRDDM